MYETVNEFFSHCTPLNCTTDAIARSLSPSATLSPDPLDGASGAAYRVSGRSSDCGFSDRPWNGSGVSVSSSQPMTGYIDPGATGTQAWGTSGATGQASFSWYDNSGQLQAWSFNHATSTTDSWGFNTGAIAPDSLTSSTPPGFQWVAGSLNADVFTYNPAIQYSLYSGNGNVNFGQGGRDVLDLSSILSTSISTTFATTTGGGVPYNPGNGTRVFDAISFSNGNQILFEGLDSIRFADGVLNLSTIPNDPGFDSQWNLHMMGVQNAWRFTTGSSAVMIGVQDTGLGVDYYGNTHPDLRTTFYYTNNYQDDYFREFPGQGYGPRSSSHGTAVEGVIAAVSNNGLGMSGINWNSDVFAIDVLDGNAGDQSLAVATQNMINAATSRGQRLVINMSLGGGSIDPTLEQLVATNRNTALFVIAAGNEDRGALSNPASLAIRYDNVVAVGASWGNQDTNGRATTPGTRISYPGWWGSNYGDGLTVMGPSEVIAPSADRSYYGVSFDYETDFNGTSAATPNVAGVASLVWSANPNLTASQVQTILSETAYDLGTPGRDRVYGNGFVNADAAVRRALAIGRGTP